MKFNYQKTEDFLEELLAQDVISEWRELTAGQYRINNLLDIYPRHKRWFSVETKERGEYKDLGDFLRLIF